jgi:hypothetical protein
MRSKRLFIGLSVAAAMLVFAVAARADEKLLRGATTGNADVKSIEAICFGPQGLLLIGDGRGNQVVAVDTGDTKEQTWSRTEIKGIKDELAGRVGTTAKGIEITKMAVNPASRLAYVAVRILSGKKDLLLTVDGSGKIGEFALDNVKHVCVKLPADTKVSKITDITWAGDRVLVAAQANETFGSKIFSIPAPLASDATCACFSTETYHVAHGRWETKAPIRTVLPYEEDGKKYLVGSFTCTPIVKYAVDELSPTATKVKGTSVIELGYGNTPQDMFSYEKDGKKYILMATYRMPFAQKKQPVGPSPHWVVRVDYNILRESTKVNQKAIVRVNANYENVIDQAHVVPAYHGVVHMDALDRARALVMRTDDKGGFDLKVLALP